MADNYEQVFDTLPFSLDAGHWHSLACCDCGLVHKMRLTVDQSGEDNHNIVLFEIKRAKGATKKRRRKYFKGLVLPKKEEA